MRHLRKKAPTVFPTQPREKRGSQFLRRPQGLHAASCSLNIMPPCHPRTVVALSGLAPSLSRLFSALCLSQPTGPVPLLGPLTALPSGEQLWPPPVCPPALAGKTISFCLSYP